MIYSLSSGLEPGSYWQLKLRVLLSISTSNDCIQHVAECDSFGIISQISVLIPVSLCVSRVWCLLFFLVQTPLDAGQYPAPFT